MAGPDSVAPSAPANQGDEATDRAKRDAPAARFLRSLCEPRPFWLCLLAMSLLILGAISLRQLVPDEAYYWVWSRHLSLSYFDHPPMVAWLIWLSTRLGTSELTVRLSATAMSIGSIPVLVRASRHAGADRTTARLCGVLLLASPLTSLLGTIETPDSPAWFFSACALAAALSATHTEAGERARLSWLLFGVFLGLASLSKYTAVLLGPAVFAALATAAHGRHHLRKPWFWLSALLAAAVFSPVLIWNAGHDWASLKFQLHHGFDAQSWNALRGVAEYIGGQIVVWTPILTVISGVAFAVSCRRYVDLPAPRRILLWSAALPLLLFLVSASRHRVELNWPALAYGPLAIMTALYVAEARPRSPALHRSPLYGWTAIGAALALAMALPAQHPEILGYSGLVIGHATQLYGYRSLGQRLGCLAAASGSDTRIFANRYQEAAEASFYIPGRPEVWSLNLAGSRPNAFDYFLPKPDLGAPCPALFLDCPHNAPTIAERFTISAVIDVPTVVAGRVLRTDRILVAKHRTRLGEIGPR